MPDSCRPPPGTKRGSLHWLRRKRAWLPAEWAGGRWLPAGGALIGHHPTVLHGAGWRYVGPCEPPEPEPDRTNLPSPEEVRGILRPPPEEMPRG